MQVSCFQTARDLIGSQLEGDPSFWLGVRLSGGLVVLPNCSVVASVSRALKHEDGVKPCFETLVKAAKVTRSCARHDTPFTA